MEGTMEEYKANLRAYHLREHIENRQRKQMSHISYHQLEEQDRQLQEEIKNRELNIRKLDHDIRETQKELFTRQQGETIEVRERSERKGLTEDTRRMKPVPSAEGLKNYKGYSPRRFKQYVKDRSSKEIRAKYNFPETEYQDAYGQWVGYD